MAIVEIDNEQLVEMLVDRVKFWTDDQDILYIYEAYYRDLVYSECFEGEPLIINSIVDNDYVNYTDVVTREELKENWDIDIDDIDDKDRILIAMPEMDGYLIRTY